MGIFEPFSMRQQRLRGNVPDVYQCDDIPEAFRNQVIHIWEEAFFRIECAPYIAQVVKGLQKAYGVRALNGRPRAPHERAQDPYSELCEFFLGESDPERVMDPVEATFQLIENLHQLIPELYYYIKRTKIKGFIEELNHRFRQNGIGYEFTNGNLIRVDSKVIHQEAVKPTLVLLSDPLYKGPQEEFLNAHAHYRKGNFKECLNECLKAFESTMKVICDKRVWAYRKKKDTSSALVKAVLDNGLLPTFLESQLGVVNSLLTSGVPTVRNRLAGHGQGGTPISVSRHEASYVLNLTATTILMLVESEQAKPQS